MRRPRLFSVACFLVSLSVLLPTANAQTSRNITLLSHLNLYSHNANSWPYIHTDGREYVAMGTSTGTSIVRLTDPSNPVEVAFVPSSSSFCTTRDVDQYQTYLYVLGGSCFSDPGMQIISMADPDHPVLVSTLHGIVETSENFTIDPSRALLYAGESNQRQGGFGLRIVSLADPLNPVVIFANDSYEVHDVTYQGTTLYASDLLNGAQHVLDVSNPAAPVEVAAFTTGGPTHSAWPSVDGRFLYVTNEVVGGGGGELIVYDNQNPAQPVEVFRASLAAPCTVHYPRVMGNRLYLAHYAAGVRTMDLSNPAWPVETGFLDTWPGDDLPFAGVYDTSPFYPSGIATASDLGTGLYVYRVSAAPYGLVRGTVLDGNNGRIPLVGATVRVLPNGPTTVTGADGRYALSPSTGAGVTIELSKFSYVTKTATLNVTQGSDQTVNFMTSKSLTGTIKGTVTRSADQTPLGLVDVSDAGTPLVTATTTRGAYSLTKVPEGPLTVRAERPGYVPASVSANLIARKTLTADFALANALFYDDADADRGWTLGAPDDNATSGQWIRAVPIGVFDVNGQRQIQPDEDHTPAPGTQCFVTGNGAVGGAINAADVDGGKTTLISPILPMAGVADPRIVFWRWYFSNNSGPSSSPLVTELSNDGGATWVFADSIQASRIPWQRVELRVTNFFPTPGNVRVRITAQDRSASQGSIIEAAIDDFEYYSGAGSASTSVASAPTETAAGAPFRARALSGSGRRPAIELRLERDEPRVAARLYDVGGRLTRTVQDGPVNAGTTRIEWDGRTNGGGRAAAGIYFLRISAAGSDAQVRVVLLR